MSKLLMASNNRGKLQEYLEIYLKVKTLSW